MNLDFPCRVAPTLQGQPSKAQVRTQFTRSFAGLEGAGLPGRRKQSGAVKAAGEGAVSCPKTNKNWPTSRGAYAEQLRSVIKALSMFKKSGRTGIAPKRHQRCGATSTGNHPLRMEG
jgi:hypothetical protein